MVKEILLTFEDIDKDSERVTISRTGFDESEILNKLREVCILLDEEESCREKTS